MILNSSIGIIGGSDGPTAVFVTFPQPRTVFNLVGLIYVVLILIPNIVYALRCRGEGNRCQNMAMNLLEQIGRYGSMVLMVTGFGVLPFGIRSIAGMAAYYVGCPLLILAYWICWIPWFRKKRKRNALALALLPTAVFVVSGIALHHWALAVCGAVFGIGHTYVTLHNL